jgi:hypothetical protein
MRCDAMPPLVLMLPAQCRAGLQPRRLARRTPPHLLHARRSKTEPYSDHFARNPEGVAQPSPRRSPGRECKQRGKPWRGDTNLAAAQRRAARQPSAAQALLPTRLFGCAQSSESRRHASRVLLPAVFLHVFADRPDEIGADGRPVRCTNLTGAFHVCQIFRPPLAAVFRRPAPHLQHLSRPPQKKPNSVFSIRHKI